MGLPLTKKREEKTRNSRLPFAGLPLTKIYTKSARDLAETTKKLVENNKKPERRAYPGLGQDVQHESPGGSPEERTARPPDKTM